MRVAKHEVGRFGPGPGRMAMRRHRMAVDQQAGAEIGRASQLIRSASESWNGSQQMRTRRSASANGSLAR